MDELDLDGMDEVLMFLSGRDCGLAEIASKILRDIVAAPWQTTRTVGEVRHALDGYLNDMEIVR